METSASFEARSAPLPYPTPPLHWRSTRNLQSAMAECTLGSNVPITAAIAEQELRTIPWLDRCGRLRHALPQNGRRRQRGDDGGAVI